MESKNEGAVKIGCGSSCNAVAAAARLCGFKENAGGFDLHKKHKRLPEAALYF